MSVALAYLHPGHVRHAFMASVIRTMRRHDGLEIWPFLTGPGSIPASRNAAVRMLLGSEHEWLWFADTDVGFEPTMLDRLLAAAEPVARPVVTAPVMAVLTGPDDGMGGNWPEIHPAVYHWTGDEEVTSLAYPLPENQTIRIGACGAAMLLIHREALEKSGPDPFTPIGVMGEDISFCRRLLNADIPIHVHTGLRTTHWKTIPLT